MAVLFSRRPAGLLHHFYRLDPFEAARAHAREHGDWESIMHGRSGRIRDGVAIH